MSVAYLPCARRRASDARRGTAFEPNVWVRITPDNKARIMLSMLEMGQGVMTAMPMLVAEELDVDWNNITTEWAPADRRYGNPNFGGSQTTAGSNSTRGMWKLLREAGASARAMLITAAAQTWNVPENQLTTERARSSTRRAAAGSSMARSSTRPRRCPSRRTRDAQGSEGVQAARQADCRGSTFLKR